MIIVYKYNLKLNSMSNLELTNTLINNLGLINTLNNLLESILYSLVIALIIHIFKFSNNKLKELTLSSLVAFLIMLISTFASYAMSTYAFVLLPLNLGQFLILKQLNITTNDTIIYEAISNGTISSINEYSLVSIYTIQNITNQIKYNTLYIVIIFIIIASIFIYEIYKRLKNANQKTKP
jgi:Na+-transporting NADH:ubiquinone oxidoreductase subunit NqrC